MYSRLFGPVDFAIKASCKNYVFSEMYEVTALCSVLKCSIRSIYSNIDMREDMGILNNILLPVPPVIAHSSITIIWSHVPNEIDARTQNNDTWSTNHFVPLIFPPTYYDSNVISHRQPSSPVVVSY